MDNYLKIVALALLGVVLHLVVAKQSPDTALLLSISVCVVILCVGISYLTPVFDYFDSLAAFFGLDKEMLGLLIKAAGVGLLGEVTALLCADAGNAAIGKAVQLASVMVVLWITLPLYQGLLELIQQIMEGL